MGQTRGQIKTSVRVNLDDAGVTFYSDDDLSESLQDAYDDIVSRSQCIVKVADNQQWPSQLTYISPVADLSLTDYLGTTAIFNYTTKLWLRDDISLRDMDKLRRDWETWQGTPQFWMPSDVKYIAVAPKYTGSTTGQLFKFIYWAQAPALVDDTSTFLIASDVQNMLEWYCTADMLETAEEYSKASAYWERYESSLVEYSGRVKRNNKADLLLRV